MSRWNPKKFTWGRFWLSGILVLSFGLRIALAMVNRQANDNHMEVIARMVVLGGAPSAQDCWSCYHPKLFHGTAAVLIKGLALSGLDDRIVAAQLLSCAAGLLTVVVLWMMVRRLPARPATRLLAFALVALNPALIGSSAQASNDSFVILFGTLTIYTLWRFLETGRSIYMVGVGLSLLLASLSKVQGIALSATVIVVLLLKVLGSRTDARRRFEYGVAAACLLSFLAATVSTLGPYYDTYRLTGSALATNTLKVEPARLFTMTPLQPKSNLDRTNYEGQHFGRPGVRSIVDAYLTFRIASLVATPYTVHTGRELRGGSYPLHRTSLWSRLYADAQFVQYRSWPPSWHTERAAILNTGRAIFILGLFGLLILMYGLALDLHDLGRGLLRNSAAWLREDQRWALLALLFASLFVVVRLSYDLRDFSAMKAVYVYPGVAAFLAVFVRGLEAVRHGLAGAGRSVYWIDLPLCLLAMSYCLDIFWLLYQLQ